MEERERIQREEGLIAKHQRATTVLWICLFATVNIILALSAWMLKDTIGKNDVILVPAMWLMMLYFVFTAYSVYACLGTEVTPTTKVSGKLLWWHGAGWLIAMALGSVAGLVTIFLTRVAG